MSLLDNVAVVIIALYESTRAREKTGETDYGGQIPAAAVGSRAARAQDHDRSHRLRSAHGYIRRPVRRWRRAQPGRACAVLQCVACAHTRSATPAPGRGTGAHRGTS